MTHKLTLVQKQWLKNISIDNIDSGLFMCRMDFKRLGIHGRNASFNDSAGRKTKLEFKGETYETLSDLSASKNITTQELIDFIEIHAINIFK